MNDAANDAMNDDAPRSAREDLAMIRRLGALGGTQVLFGGSLRVGGDVRVAKGFKRLFDTLDPDFEEALARVGGDVPAHETGRAVGEPREAEAGDADAQGFCHLRPPLGTTARTRVSGSLRDRPCAGRP